MATTQIVLAWVNEDYRVVGPPVRTDLGERPKFETFKVGAAAMWLNRGKPADVAKARAYATLDGERTIHVLTYASTVRDPLAQARKDVLALETT